MADVQQLASDIRIRQEYALFGIRCHVFQRVCLLCKIEYVIYSVKKRARMFSSCWNCTKKVWSEKQGVWKGELIMKERFRRASDVTCHNIASNGLESAVFSFQHSQCIASKAEYFY